MPAPVSQVIAKMRPQQFISEYSRLGPVAMAIAHEVPKFVIKNKAHNLRENGYEMDSPIPPRQPTLDKTDYPQRQHVEITNGVAIIAGDFHYWPDQVTVIHRAIIKMIHELTPQLVVLNGDVVDMAAASRHPPIGWEHQPTVQDEIEAAQERLAEFLKAMTKKTRKTWNLGNHDARFETRLAAVAPQYAKVAGIHLADHFPEWGRAWSTWINGEVVTKHRWKGGDHATFNNTIKSGKTIITGHLHSAQVRPFTDYNGTRWGVDHGTAADAFGPQFTNYTEDSPRNWVSAFCVLTFLKGRLLWPELVTKFDDNHVEFRGKVIKV